MTKKQKREQNKKMRVFIPFNTGTRVEKHAKQYDRKTAKRELRKMISE